MPNRILRDCTDSEAVNRLSDKGERLFMRLIMVADDYGRFSGNPKVVKGKCVPLLEWTTKDTGKLLIDMHLKGVIKLYGARDQVWLEIQNFNQRTRADKSKCPNPEIVVPSDGGQLTTSGGLDVCVDVFVFGDVDEIARPPSCPPPVVVESASDRFEEFWLAYDYKKGKAEARAAFMKAYDGTDELFAAIIHGAKMEAKGRPKLLENQSTPKWAQGWLTAKRWQDYEKTQANPVDNMLTMKEIDVLKPMIDCFYPAHKPFIDQYTRGEIKIPSKIKNHMKELLDGSN